MSAQPNSKPESTSNPVCSPRELEGEGDLTEGAVGNAALTPRQLRFVSEYLKDFNGTAAAVRAGYSAYSARVHASRMLANVSIAHAVQDGLQHLLESNEVTAARTIRQLALIAFFDPAKLFDPDGHLLPVAKMPHDVRHALAGMEASRSLTTEEGNVDETPRGRIARTTTEKVRFGGRVAALIALAKHFGVFNGATVDEDQRALGHERERAYLEESRAALCSALETSTDRDDAAGDSDDDDAEDR